MTLSLTRSLTLLLLLTFETFDHSDEETLPDQTTQGATSTVLHPSINVLWLNIYGVVLLSLSVVCNHKYVNCAPVGCIFVTIACHVISVLVRVKIFPNRDNSWTKARGWSNVVFFLFCPKHIWVSNVNDVSTVVDTEEDFVLKLFSCFLDTALYDLLAYFLSKKIWKEGIY